MAVSDTEVLTRRFGYAGLFLRRWLDRAFPEDKGVQKAYANRIADLNARQLGEGELSRWLSGERKSDMDAVRILFGSSKGLSKENGGVDAICASLQYLYDNQPSLPDCIGIAAPPQLAKDFLGQCRAVKEPVAQLPATVPSGGAPDAAETSDDPQLGEGASIDIEEIDETADVETGALNAGQGSGIRIANVKGRLKIGNATAGWRPPKK